MLDRYVDGYREALACHERGLVEAEGRFEARSPRMAGGPPEKTKQVRPW